MEDELNFLPWWIRHQRWVLAGAMLALVAGLGGWFYADMRRVKDARRCDPQAEAEQAAFARGRLSR